MNRLEIVNNISTNIERERIKLGMSQAQFAKALDMSLSTYKRIANGESSRIRRLHRLPDIQADRTVFLRTNRLQ